jgi:acyl-CoA thioester hydrolase
MISVTNDLITRFKHKTDIQIRFKDIDQLGHVNNANHLTYFETSRVKYFNDIFAAETNWKEIGLILAHTEISYKKPIFLEDEISCYTKISKIGNKSFDIENIIVRKEKQVLTVCAYGKSVLVCLNYLTKETISMPVDWVKSIQLFEEI